MLGVRLEAKRGIKHNLSCGSLVILNMMGKWEESDFPGVLSIIQFGTRGSNALDYFQLPTFMEELKLSDLCPDIS